MPQKSQAYRIRVANHMTVETGIYNKNDKNRNKHQNRNHHWNHDITSRLGVMT